MLPKELTTAIEGDFKTSIDHNPQKSFYLSSGSNGSVFRLAFTSGHSICVKKIHLANRSARNEYNCSKAVYNGRHIDGSAFTVTQYTDRKHIFFCIPFFPGESLDTLLKCLDFSEWPFDLTARLMIAKEIFAALRTQVHANGVIHRDLKADNIMVDFRPDKTFAVNIIDFGRSVCIWDKEETTHNVMGTPRELSLFATNSFSFAFFHPLVQKIRQWTQHETAPEFLSTTSHKNDFDVEAAGVGFRSDYYSFANLFQRLVPEHKDLANEVLTTHGIDRNHAFDTFLAAFNSLLPGTSALKLT